MVEGRRVSPAASSTPPRLQLSGIAQDTLNCGCLPAKTKTAGEMTPSRLEMFQTLVRLCRKRCAAAAAAGRVRILEGKSRSHHVRRIVDGHAIQILGREHIDKELDAMLVDEKIALTRLFLDIEAVLKT